MNKRHIEPDQGLLAALDAGMPACAGVALGVDRLLMCLLELTSIEQVQSFRG
jgi:Truncated, possibly inactive, lysyl-tRNA synthetase (class II)